MAVRRSKKQTSLDLFPPAPIEDASLSDEAQRRYLHYALSVITARALPDIRDGLKPVQRRILYAMFHELHLRSDSKPRKCALIVGDVMGKFHPHGDSAIYEALVRMAQSFTMRMTLVDGRGNFGSPDGDSAAAMRYTEARLAAPAIELLSELGKRTVHFRPNYDGTRFEPIVLPARFPHLLVNGSQGIAVGMATSIPPHHLGEVIDACILLIDDPAVTLQKVLKKIQGPDFPTGGQLLSTRKEIEAVYAAGQGSLKLRGEWKLEDDKRSQSIIIHSIPYAVERSQLVREIAEVILSRKLPLLIDVRDESTDDCRIVLESKKEAEPALIMTYLYKHTALQTNVQVNLTCLVPTANPEISAPKRLDLTSILRHFLDFRMEVVTRRLQCDLEELKKRIHLLEGFEKIFDVLDETIRIIRRSDGKKDAAEKLMERFELDEEQVEAILELKLYRLAKLEILVIQKELKEKRAEAKRISALLKDETSRWQLIRAELLELKTQYANPRRTKIVGVVEEPVYDAEAFIVEEDAAVILTQQGWLKRQRSVKDVASTRMREGDQVLNAVAGSTKALVAFFSSHGACYVMRIADIPPSTGHGVPVQTLFKLADGERMIRMLSLDARVLDVPTLTDGAAEPEPPFAVAVSKQGMVVRFSLRGHRDVSTRAGRKYMKLRQDDEVLYVEPTLFKDRLACASVKGHALICDALEVPVLASAGKGVMLIKLTGDDVLIGAKLLRKNREGLSVENESGRKFEISESRYEVVSRGGKGHALFKRGQLVRVLSEEIVLTELTSHG